MDKIDKCICGGRLNIYAQNTEKNQALFMCIDCDNRYLYGNGTFKKLTKSQARRIKLQAKMINI